MSSYLDVDLQVLSASVVFVVLARSLCGHPDAMHCAREQDSVYDEGECHWTPEGDQVCKMVPDPADARIAIPKLQALALGEDQCETYADNHGGYTQRGTEVTAKSFWTFRGKLYGRSRAEGLR